MLRIDQPRGFPRACGLVLALAAGLSVTPADARTKKATIEASTSDVGLTVTAPQMRFFTINDVLAKHDGLRRKASGPVEVAATDPSARAGVAGDAPRLPAISGTTDEPFGLMTFRAPEGVLWTKWRGVKAIMTSDAASITACKQDDDRCSPVERRFLAMTRSAAAETDLRARAEIINRNVNEAVRYVGDYQHHGVADLWSPPLTTLRSGLGDCEDYAIAKYALLLAAGTPETDLKLLLVRDLAVRQDHAVLAVRIDGRWSVLDNRRAALMEGRDLRSFMPLFAIDHRGVSLFAAPYAERPHHESETDIAPAANVDISGGPSSDLPLQL